MLEVIIPASELYDDKNNEFIYTKETKLKLEHSLISLKKWESKWHKPFLTTDKSYEELIDYIKCMTIEPIKDEIVYKAIPRSTFYIIIDYIKDPMTATWFSKASEDKLKSNKKETITNEIIYYWMIELGIPFECQKWHINQLLTLIKVIQLKSSSSKMSKKDEKTQRDMLNKQRRMKYKSRG